jgi:hypothetical protein
MRGHSQVRFLGGWVGAIPPGYPTRYDYRMGMSEVQAPVYTKEPAPRLRYR